MTSDLPKTIRQLAGIAPVIPKFAESILLLIDEQNEYVEGPLQLKGIAEAHAVNIRVLDAARNAGAAIVHIAQKGGAGGPFDRAAHRGQFIRKSRRRMASRSSRRPLPRPLPRRRSMRCLAVSGASRSSSSAI